MEEHHVPTAGKALWDKFDAAWIAAGRPSAEEICTVAQEVLDHKLSEPTVRGWIKHAHLPRSADHLLVAMKEDY